MMQVLVVGASKTGTTVVSKSIQYSIPKAYYYMEPRTISEVENLSNSKQSLVVKILYSQWRRRLNLFNAIALSEIEFKPNFKVAIVRDPRDTVISKMMYRPYNFIINGATRDQVDRWLDCVRRKESAPESLSVMRMFEEMSTIFIAKRELKEAIEDEVNYLDWVSSHKENFFVLRYEDFVADNVSSLEDYLGIKLSISRDVGPYERVQRTRKSGNWKTLMLPDDIDFIRNNFGPMLERHGYDDWCLSEKSELDPVHGTQYIQRIAQEAFSVVYKNRGIGRNEPCPCGSQKRFKHCCGELTS
ncbi:MAG: SEC-C metal-binding domain-containing protein [Candidatus Contendobacter sp.]|nr:SEC-C metal-binding domain-containing protein [Candidatus Contendobacter sp.]MDG4558127.1 SEC-C metal-binding domain-containing protein [Candidatus Contendobacter sp.]